MDVSRLKIVNDNILLVDGEVMKAKEYSPDEFSHVLKIGRGIIISAISETYDKYSEMNDEKGKLLEGYVPVQRGPVFAMRLGTKVLDVLDKDYYYGPYKGITHSSRGLKPKYVEYFDAVADSQFIPEVRTDMRLPSIDGVVLGVRDTQPLVIRE